MLARYMVSISLVSRARDLKNLECYVSTNKTDKFDPFFDWIAIWKPSKNRKSLQSRNHIITK